MGHVVRFLGLAGAVLLLFGLVSYGLTRRFDLWTAVHVGGGGTLLAVGVLLNLAGVRRTAASAGTRARIRAVTGTILFLGILVAANLLAERVAWRWDVTEARIHTLSGQSRAIVAGLDHDIELLAFWANGDPERQRVATLLDRFASAGPRLRWRFVDPDREPEVADAAGVRRSATLVARRLDAEASAAVQIGGLLSEGRVANLLLRVDRSEPVAVYALSGHGEPAVEDLAGPDGMGLLGMALAETDVRLRPLLLSASPGVPEDAALVVLAAPSRPLADVETAGLRTYLEEGGRLLVLVDPAVPSGIESLLPDFRVGLGDDMIVDREVRPYFGARLGVDPIVDTFGDHPATRGVRERRERVVLRQARSVEVLPSSGLPGVEVRVIATTRPEAWAESDYREMIASGRVSRDPGDRAGPLPVAVAAWRGGVEDGPIRFPPARLVVVGDGDLVRNENLDRYGNRDFILDVVQWLTGHEELIGERPRGLRASRLDMTEADYRNLFRLGVLLLPEAFLIVGLGVAWRRRTL